MKTATSEGATTRDDPDWCLLCAGPGLGDVVDVHLTHGVQVALCHEHRSDGFRHDHGGTIFTDALRSAWRAAGRLTRRHVAALRAHERRIETAHAERDKPGSYSWPRLRGEAERRFAAGDPPHTVIAELRERLATSEAVAPSVRTMRRWFTQARWLRGGTPGTARDGDLRPRKLWRPSPLTIEKLDLLYGFLAYPRQELIWEWRELERRSRPRE